MVYSFSMLTDVLSVLPDDYMEAVLVGRIYDPNVEGPCVVVIREDHLLDISQIYPTLSDLFESPNPHAAARSAEGDRSWSLKKVLNDSLSKNVDAPTLLAPIDLSVVKATGVSFAASMLERVIEERAGGDPATASKLREELEIVLKNDISSIVPGSQEAADLAESLKKKGMWSQYLEVGIGPDPEIFTKAPVLAAVGFGQDIGVARISSWNNPEPEIVLVVSSQGHIVGATLGNDVNLRDVEGRSALLLGRAKDNNASAALGPFVRLFDDHFTIEDVKQANVDLHIDGVDDNFELSAVSSMSKISRDPEDIVRYLFNGDHHYPDGAFLYLGTLFSPTNDRGEVGQGFTHHTGDIVKISSPRLGQLRNTVTYADIAPAWNFGIRALIQNLTERGLIDRVGTK
jgi:fumarylacetoacetate (FAA) hydrolase family protein